MDQFVVSARKYRPADFRSVVGQQHITSTLKNAIARNQLAHAYLFCGPRGVGKTTCARIFAKAINCLSPVDSEACNQCESCLGFNEGRSFNIHELDGASNNSVDNIRSLTEQVRIPPQIGRYSIYIIDEVHMLSASAFNAFLKTLEEPPAHAVFILATTEKHKIIPTILSRCQIFDFNRIRVEDSVGYLKYIAGEEGVTADDESLHLIAQKADGGMRDALSMFDKSVSYCGGRLDFKEVAASLNILDFDTYFNVTSLILAGNYPAALLLFDEVLRKGFSGQTFITGLNRHFRDLLMCKSPHTIKLIEMTGSMLERYKTQAAECQPGFLFDAISLLTTIDGSLRTSSNQRLSVELGLMKLCGPGQKKNELTDREPPMELPALGRERDTADAAPSAIASAAASASAPEPTSAKPESVPAPEAPKQDVVRPAAAPPPTVEKDASAQPSAPAESPSAVMPADPPEKTSSVPDEKPLSGSPLFGSSIASILSAPRKEGAYDEEEIEDTPEIVDPDCEAKIKKATHRFLQHLQSERPRIAMAFQEMEVEGNEVRINVPNDPLREEILRNRQDILELLAATAGVNGVITLEVVLVEKTNGLKPVRPEDKLKFLTEKNPLLTRLRKDLDLDME